MNRKLFCLLVLTLSLPGVVFAVVVDDLYSAELPVDNQAASLRLDAFTQAFKQVIVKVSGSDDALSGPDFERQIKRSSRYVKQFSYATQERENGEGISVGQLYLKIDFDQRLIEKLLRDNKLPLWGSERPASLFVTSYAVQDAPVMVSQDSTSRLVGAIDIAAAKLGLPILFPLMDLEDIALVNVDDIASRQFEKITTMASRYSANTLVVGAIKGRSGVGWEGDWAVRFLDQEFQWRYQGATRQAVVDQVIKRLAKILAKEYALDETGSVAQSFLMSVSSVAGINGLVEVRQYLQSLNVADSIRIAKIDADVVTFSIKLRNKIEDMQRLIEFGDVLEQADYPQLDAQNAESVTLNYAYFGRGGVN